MVEDEAVRKNKALVFYLKLSSIWKLVVISPLPSVSEQRKEKDWTMGPISLRLLDIGSDDKWSRPSSGMPCMQITGRSARLVRGPPLFWPSAWAFSLGQRFLSMWLQSRWLISQASPCLQVLLCSSISFYAPPCTSLLIPASPCIFLVTRCYNGAASHLGMVLRVSGIALFAYIFFFFFSHIRFFFRPKLFATLWISTVKFSSLVFSINTKHSGLNWNLLIRSSRPSQAKLICIECFSKRIH